VGYEDVDVDSLQWYKNL